MICSLLRRELQVVRSMGARIGKHTFSRNRANRLALLEPALVRGWGAILSVVIRHGGGAKTAKLMLSTFALARETIGLCLLVCVVLMVRLLWLPSGFRRLRRPTRKRKRHYLIALRLLDYRAQARYSFRLAWRYSGGAILLCFLREMFVKQLNDFLVNARFNRHKFSFRWP